MYTTHMNKQNSAIVVKQIEKYPFNFPQININHQITKNFQFHGKKECLSISVLLIVN